ncbi:DUF1653 domain-containing protein [Colwellia sp. 4_MG-2023]|jgi:hypothetical protein|uniref:DUF1653 domain-containing protein n=1 Tax=unclassified Colwellia TaxID=196834 RepID=UPI001C090843|nr:MULTISPECIES: DUF1653 domain-containing protein [unclassified Colwellia]MBU2924364.1 DUF1653 domain-containing protein [Colwellia sp. C2M11]MDO6505411.1 DUF1653 domain-containing protein [Colwellia sp. 5_MG-2023]MDO6554293.1 DUF1653 domain-containing protein [Colwellia sp. 4_MG-2023]MDO6650834.1 DUF1653 domain-containing protein [Colwellia sp. 3_MG-2023]MDO6663869.1 DUF1653 domain-containing protein [Colwellia sp. 2_MG-2023]
MIKLGKYQHFKGNYYQVLHLAKHSETEEYLVVYHPFDNVDDIWVRPLAMFNETIVRDGKKIQRFKYIEE